MAMVIYAKHWSLTAAILLLTGTASDAVAASSRDEAERLPGKPVLSYLLDHAGLADQLADELGWQSAEVDRLQEAAWEIHAQAEERRLTSDLMLRSAAGDPVLIRAEVDDFNRQVATLLKRTRGRLRTQLGESRWSELTARALAAFAAEGVRRGSRLPDRSGAFVSYTVFCTQYLSETAWEIAVPDQYVKFANRDWAYEPGYPDGYYGVRLTRGATVVEDVPVWDVGPWNIDDNYWNPAGAGARPRRLFTDLAQGLPEAEAAFYDNYNGGLDQFGRTVLNPGGCDLSLDVATALGLAYLENDWIQVEYKWEKISGGEEIILDNPQVVSLQGPWETGTSSPDKYGSDYYWTSTGTADVRYCVWSFDLASGGSYDVSLWWPEGSNRSPAAEVGVKQGAAILSTVNQQANGGRWNSLGTFSFDAGAVLVGLRNGGVAGWIVLCDAARLERLN